MTSNIVYNRPVSLSLGLLIEAKQVVLLYTMFKSGSVEFRVDVEMCCYVVQYETKWQFRRAMSHLLMFSFQERKRLSENYEPPITAREGWWRKEIKVCVYTCLIRNMSFFYFLCYVSSQIFS